MEAWPQAWGWASLALLAAVAAGCCVGATVGFLIGQALAPRLLARRARAAAVREDRNGRALLRMAAEMEAYAAALSATGQSGHDHRKWSRLCRHVAAEHLESINHIMLLEGYLDLPRTGPPGGTPRDPS